MQEARGWRLILYEKRRPCGSKVPPWACDFGTVWAREHLRFWNLVSLESEISGYRAVGYNRLSVGFSAQVP